MLTDTWMLFAKTEYTLNYNFAFCLSQYFCLPLKERTHQQNQ